MKHKILTLLTLATLTACGGQNQAASTASQEAAVASAIAEASSPAPSCAPATKPEMLAIETARGCVDVPKNPERIAVYDWGMLDTLTQLGVPVGASTDATRLPIIKDVVEKAVHVGTLFEPNYEALNAYQPQLIITGSRTAKAYEQLTQIAPTIEMTADTKNMRASTLQRIDQFAEIFGKQAEAAQLKERINQAFETAKQAANGKGTGLVIIVNAGKVAAFGPDSRMGGWIHRDIGLPIADPSIKEGSHGQPASFEYIQKTNPDWLFVLDRSAAIGEEGEAAAKVLDNPLVHQTSAWQKGQIVYLPPSNYLAAGGAGSLLEAVEHLTQAFNKGQTAAASAASAAQ